MVMMKAVRKMRYSKIATKDKGGFGKTIEFLDSHLDRRLIKKEVLCPAGARRLLDEIKALQVAKSRNVVQIYDVKLSTKSDEIAIYEEYLSGPDLMDFRADDENMDEYLKVLYQLACGLSDIHNCGIVHRDFKPNNVKYDDELILKIFDFGLAKIGALPTSTVGFSGTPGFMAPELFHDPPVIDKAIDCYSFGVTAFFFILGKRPKCSISKPVPRAMKDSEGILSYISLSKEMGELLNRCLDVDPAKRPTMGEIRDRLEKEILYEKHRATVILDNKIYYLNKANKGVKISRGVGISARIKYDGYQFSIFDAIGDVYVNNFKVDGKYELPGSSVITLGGPELRWARSFATFDISHPEVII